MVWGAGGRWFRSCGPPRCGRPSMRQALFPPPAASATSTSGRRPQLETQSRMRNLRGLGFGDLVGHPRGVTEFVRAGLLDQPPGLANHALRLATARLVKGLDESCEKAHQFTPARTKVAV